MRVRLRHAAAAVFLPMAASACSLLSWDGFVGPPEDGSPPEDDAAEPSDAGGTTDGASDTDGGASSDAQTEASDDDASSDAGTDADPNAPPIFQDGGSFCAGKSTAAFCEDFDEVPLDKRWIREGTFGRLTSYNAKSAPNDFLVSAPPNTGGGTFVSKITKTMPAPSTNLLVSFDLFPEKINENSSVLMLAALEYTGGESKYSLRLVYLNGQIRLEESDLVPPPNNKDSYHPFFDVTVGRWSRIGLDVDLSDSPPGVTISVDGITVGSRLTVTPTANMQTVPTLLLGAVFAQNPHSGWTLRYDDVLVEYRQ